MIGVVVCLSGVVVWFCSVIRDVRPDKALHATGLALLMLVPAALFGGFGPTTIGLGVGCILIAFTIVTRGHVIQAVDSDTALHGYVEPRLAVAKQQVRRNQIRGIVLGSALWGIALLVSLA